MGYLACVLLVFVTVAPLMAANGQPGGDAQLWVQIVNGIIMVLGFAFNSVAQKRKWGREFADRAAEREQKERDHKNAVAEKERDRNWAIEDEARKRRIAQEDEDRKQRLEREERERAAKVLDERHKEVKVAFQKNDELTKAAAVLSEKAATQSEKAATASAEAAAVANNFAKKLETITEQFLEVKTDGALAGGAATSRLETIAVHSKETAEHTKDAAQTLSDIHHDNEKK